MTEVLLTIQETGCACVHQDPVVCFYIRYHKNPLELTKEDICECECHADFDPTDAYGDDNEFLQDDYAKEEISNEEFQADLDRENREDWKQEDGDSDE